MVGVLGICLLVFVRLYSVEGALRGEYGVWVFYDGNLVSQLIDPSIKNITIFYGSKYYGGDFRYHHNDNFFTVVWKGNITAPISKYYTFDFTVDGNIQVDFNGNETLQTFTSGSFNPFYMAANEMYEMSIIFRQYFGDYLLDFKSSDPGCCDFVGPVEVSVYSYDPNDYPHTYFRNDSLLNFTVFDTYEVMQWSGFLIPPPEFYNQNITLQFDSYYGVGMYINDEMIIDSYFNNTQIKYASVLVSPGAIWPIVIKSWSGSEGGFLKLEWGIQNSPLSLVPASAYSLFYPSSDFKGNTVIPGNSISGSIRVLPESNVNIKGDTNLDSLYLTAISSLLSIFGNLTILHDTEISGLLTVHGYLSVTTALINTSLISNQVPVSISKCFSDSSNSNITFFISPTNNSQGDNYYPMIEHNCSDTFFDNNPIQFTISKQVQVQTDNTWNCNDKQTYQLQKNTKSVGILVSSQKGCGVGVIIVSAVGGGIILIMIILVIIAVSRNVHRFSTMEKQIAKKLHTNDQANSP